MGFFDFLKNKKSPESTNDLGTQQPTDSNALLLLRLEEKIITAGYTVTKHPQYASLIIENEIEIATFIIENPDYHPSLMHLMIVTIHRTYFPSGIEENIVGVGQTIDEKIESVLNNYIYTTFTPIIESFTEFHHPELDFQSDDVLWHPNLGNVMIQGNSDIQIEKNQLFLLLKDELKKKCSADKKFHWLKIYISKQANKESMGECLLDNEPWEAGIDILYDFAETWNYQTNFVGVKQFIMIKKCDLYDTDAQE